MVIFWCNFHNETFKRWMLHRLVSAGAFASLVILLAIGVFSSFIASISTAVNQSCRNKDRYQNKRNVCQPICYSWTNVSFCIFFWCPLSVRSRPHSKSNVKLLPPSRAQLKWAKRAQNINQFLYLFVCYKYSYGSQTISDLFLDSKRDHSQTTMAGFNSKQCLGSTLNTLRMSRVENSKCHGCVKQRRWWGGVLRVWFATGLVYKSSQESFCHLVGWSISKQDKTLEIQNDRFFPLAQQTGRCLLSQGTTPSSSNSSTRGTCLWTSTPRWKRRCFAGHQLWVVAHGDTKCPVSQCHKLVRFISAELFDSLFKPHFLGQEVSRGASHWKFGLSCAGATWKKHWCLFGWLKKHEKNISVDPRELFHVFPMFFQYVSLWFDGARKVIIFFLSNSPHSQGRRWTLSRRYRNDWRFNFTWSEGKIFSGGKRYETETHKIRFEATHWYTFFCKNMEHIQEKIEIWSNQLSEESILIKKIRTFLGGVGDWTSSCWYFVFCNVLYFPGRFLSNGGQTQKVPGRSFVGCFHFLSGDVLAHFDVDENLAQQPYWGHGHLLQQFVSQSLLWRLGHARAGRNPLTELYSGSPVFLSISKPFCMAWEMVNHTIYGQIWAISSHFGPDRWGAFCASFSEPGCLLAWHRLQGCLSSGILAAAWTMIEILEMRFATWEVFGTWRSKQEQEQSDTVTGTINHGSKQLPAWKYFFCFLVQLPQRHQEAGTMIYLHRNHRNLSWTCWELLSWLNFFATR